MPKKKVMIYIEEDVWLGIKSEAFRLSSVERRVSVGDYVTRMFRNGKPKVVPEMKIDKIVAHNVQEEVRKEVVIDSDVGGHVYDAPEKSDVIEKAREKIDNMVNKDVHRNGSYESYFIPKPKGKDGKK